MGFASIARSYAKAARHCSNKKKTCIASPHCTLGRRDATLSQQHTLRRRAATRAQLAESNAKMANAGWTSQETVNWDDVSTEAPPPLANGIYKGLFVKAEPSPTKENKPAIKIELMIDGAYGGDVISPSRKMFDNVTLIKEAAFRVKQLAAAAGVAPPASFGYADVEAFCVALCDAGPVWLRSKQTTWEGKTNAKVDRYLTEAQAGEAANASGGAAPTAAERPAPRVRRAKAE